MLIAKDYNNVFQFVKLCTKSAFKTQNYVCKRIQSKADGQPSFFFPKGSYKLTEITKRICELKMSKTMGITNLCLYKQKTIR